MVSSRHGYKRGSLSCFLVVSAPAVIHAFIACSRLSSSFCNSPVGAAGSLCSRPQHLRASGSRVTYRRGNPQLPVMPMSRDGSNEPMDMEEQRERSESDMDDQIFKEVQRRDWRLFRKNLISRYGEGSTKSRWGEGRWAHEIGVVEPGCLLLATEEIWDGPFRQSVILVLSHDTQLGSVGLILNHPGPQRLSTLAGLKPDLAQVFAESQVFDGGPVGLDTMTVVHAAEGVEGSELVLPGVYAGGFDSLVEMAHKGTVDKSRVRFVHGHAAWAPGQLQGELSRNQWFVASAAPELVTADCDKSYNQLWGEVLGLMGGSYQEVAKRYGYFA